MKTTLAKTLFGFLLVCILTSFFASATGVAAGTVVAWGDNSEGQTNVPAGLTDAVAIAAGYTHSLVLKADGTVVAWGDNAHGQTNVPPDLTNVMAIAAGRWHSVALQRDGTVVAWSDNSRGETNVPIGLSDVTAIVAGESHSLALRKNGTVVAWGYDSAGQATAPPGLTNVVGIGAGEAHSLAVRNDGTVVAWGEGLNNQTNVPQALSNVIAVTGGSTYSLALKANGEVEGWGNASYGELSIPASLTNAVAIDGGLHHALALTSDGRVVCWGAQTNAPVGLPHVAAISARGNHSLALAHVFTNGVLLADLRSTSCSGSASASGRDWDGSIIIRTGSFSHDEKPRPAFADFSCSQGDGTGASTVQAHASASASAWQESKVSGAHFEARGGAQIDVSADRNGPWGGASAHARASSLFEIVFRLDAPHDYTLQHGPEGPPTLTDLSSGIDALSSSSLTGLVQPGTYRLRIDITFDAGTRNEDPRWQMSNSYAFSIDLSPSQIVCPTNMFVAADSGQCSKSNVIYAPTVAGGLTVTNVICMPPSGSTFLKGVTAVTCPTIDSNGNPTSCTFTVTVLDAEPPVVVCPADLAVSADAGNCSASNVVYAVTASDNCAVSSVVCVPPSASSFAVGEHVVTCTATDSSGNTSQCGFSVTTVGLPLTIVRQPSPRSNVAGSSVTFAVTAVGTEPLSYQWQKDGTNLPDATARTHTIMALTDEHAGNYCVVVTDACGTTQTSSNASLTVTPLVPPAVLAGPLRNSANDHLYYLLDQSTWVEAEAAAVQLGGHLATVRNAAEQEWIVSTFSRFGGVARDLWIGLYDADPLHNATTPEERRTEFVWASQEPVTFSFWDSVEPNNYRDLGEFWVEMISPDVSADGRWNDAPDTDANYAPLHGVAEVIVKFLPPTVVGGQIQFRLLGEVGKSYVIEFSTDLLEWHELTTLTAPNGVVSFDAPAAGSSGFFRCVLKP